MLFDRTHKKHPLWFASLQKKAQIDPDADFSTCCGLKKNGWRGGW